MIEFILVLFGVLIGVVSGTVRELVSEDYGEVAAIGAAIAIFSVLTAILMIAAYSVGAFQ